MKAVRYDKYGGTDVLKVVEVPIPVPGEGQALVRVKAAGINPGEASIREGKLAGQWPTKFPSGQGSDFAGIVEQTGGNVANVATGDEVIGFTNGRASHAGFVIADANNLIHRVPKVPWEQAGALFVAGTTAFACVKAVALDPGDTVAVSAAAGGVGSIVVQLARNAGAKVIGLASEHNHKWLAAHGAIPVTYGEGMADRIRAASGGRINAFIDTFGHGYVELAINLGVAPGRINTTIDFDAAAKYGVRTQGNKDAATAGALAELAGLIEKGRLEIPIAKAYPLTEVQDAYRELEKRHTHGKIVLIP